MDKSYGRVKHIASNGREMKKKDPEKERRLAEALRANLRKRKMQQDALVSDESREDAPQ